MRWPSENHYIIKVEHLKKNATGLLVTSMRTPTDLQSKTYQTETQQHLQVSLIAVLFQVPQYILIIGVHTMLRPHKAIHTKQSIILYSLSTFYRQAKELIPKKLNPIGIRLKNTWTIIQP